MRVRPELVLPVIGGVVTEDRPLDWVGDVARDVVGLFSRSCASCCDSKLTLGRAGGTVRRRGAKIAASGSNGREALVIRS